MLIYEGPWSSSPILNEDPAPQRKAGHSAAGLTSGGSLRIAPSLLHQQWVRQ